MSTDFRPLGHIPFLALFDGRLEQYGVREDVHPGSPDDERYLVDANGMLAVDRTEDGGCSFTRTATMGKPDDILRAIQQEFCVPVVSEHDRRCYGYETEEEWDAALDADRKEHYEAFYHEVIKHLRGEPTDLKPGTVGMAQAEIARVLVAKSPGLLAAENRDILMSAVDNQYHHAEEQWVRDIRADLPF